MARARPQGAGRAHTEKMAEQPGTDDSDRLTQQAIIDLETAETTRRMRDVPEYLEDRIKKLSGQESDLTARRRVADARDDFARLRQIHQDARDTAADERD